MKLLVTITLCAVAIAGCVSAFTPSYANAPPKPGPDGVPTFEGLDFRHPANEPFFCFRHVAPQGDEVSSCREIKEWCASALRDVQRNGLTVLSGCAPTDTVTCLTFYRGDATKTSCYATPSDCDVAHRTYLAPEYGARRDQLTNCTTIDQTFQPRS